jgi:hypothetical protein
MVRVRALRGVCVGVDRHLLPGETADIDSSQLSFLVSIRAVELAPEVPVETPVDTKAPAKPGKKE